MAGHGSANQSPCQSVHMQCAHGERPLTGLMTCIDRPLYSRTANKSKNAAMPKTLLVTKCQESQTSVLAAVCKINQSKPKSLSKTTEPFTNAMCLI